MISKDLTEFVRQWYPDHFDVEVGEPFIKFAASASAFVALYLPYDTIIPRFVLSSAPTAFTDQRDIYFPELWLDVRWVRSLNHAVENDLPDAASMLILINGGILHELGHIINSNGMMDRVKKLGSQRSLHSDTIGHILGIAQLVEDVFLTKWWEARDSHVANFHWAINEMYFTTAGIERLISIETLSSFKMDNSFLFLKEVSRDMASFKHPRCLSIASSSSAPFISELAQIFETIHHGMSVPKRVDVVFDVFDLFQRYAEEADSTKDGEASDEKGEEGGNGDKKEGGSSSNKKGRDGNANGTINPDGTYDCLECNVADNGWESASNGGGHRGGHRGGRNNSDAHRLVQALNESLMKAILNDRSRVDQIRESSNTESKTTVTIYRSDIDGESFSEHRQYDIMLDHRFLGFGSILHFMRATRGGFEPRMKSGKLDKRALQRIVMDGRVMKRRNDEEGNIAIDLEVIQLIDWSGSMDIPNDFPGDWNGDGIVTTRTCSFREAVSGAAAGAAIAMTHGNIPNALFSHTSHPRDWGQPYVSDIYQYRMGPQSSIILPTNLIRHINDVSKRVPGLSNSDHLAIRQVAKSFTSKRNLKVLIVYSDGAPTPRGMSEDNAIAITAAEIVSLRHKGISVLSMSLTSSVWEANDRIYGSENNVHLDEHSDITQILTTTIRRLSTRR